MKIFNVVGARPNFMKIAPILKEIERYSEMQGVLVHTGQHYDERMSKIFFDELELPMPDEFLGIGSGSHAIQTGKAMMALEQSMIHHQPDLVLVVGDVNSTLAGALAAAKLNIPVAHVEAGLRSRDRTMPEEINRICTDSISTLFFTTSHTATDHLVQEGVNSEDIYFVGNVMIDSLIHYIEKAKASNILNDLKIEPKSYGLLTLHHPENVDDPEIFERLLEAIATLSQRTSFIFPVHPRTQCRLDQFGLRAQLDAIPRVIQTPPLGYLDFLNVLSQAKFALIDSSGVQEETTVLGIPCLTMRDNTERPETVTEGTNRLVGRDSQRIVDEVHSILDGEARVGQIPERWDGASAQRIMQAIAQWWERQQDEESKAAFYMILLLIFNIQCAWV
ncbi:MAG: UDP-N-acetylglucosamine 2-epimerase (non-hydrolyzing) [Elainellaceae cyanobacterium]